jgi:hypothetical protein
MSDKIKQLNNFDKEKDSSGDNAPSIKSSFTLMKYINNNQSEELSELLENESFCKGTMNACFQKALQKYKSSGDMIDIIDLLLK